MTTRTLGQLLYALRQGDLLLPNFQRPFVWNPERWQSLIASILLEYPVGQALIGTEADSKMMSINNPMSISDKALQDILLKKVGLTQDDVKGLKATEYLQTGNAYQCEYLLDGQQRLTALDLILGTTYHFAGSELNRNYRLRWFLNLNKLGLQELKWLNVREMQHEDVCEAFVFLKYKKNDRTSLFYHGRSESELADLCIVRELQNQSGLEDGVYLPMDKLYIENENDKSIEFDPTKFLIDLFDERQDIIIAQTFEGKSLKQTYSNGEIEKTQYDEQWKKLRRNFLSWRAKLQELLTDIIRFQVPVLEVPSKEFNRLSGIFSVINMGGVELETFDLLVAKTTTKDSSLRDIMRSACAESTKDFKKHINLIPEAARGEGIDSFWNIGYFLGEKNIEATQQVDRGSKFPESIARSFAQTISLHAKLSHALGDDWSVRNNLLDSNNIKDIKKAAISIIELKDWGYSDKIILNLSPQNVQAIQEQAAKQLLRAYFFMKARLGISKLSNLPYRQMDLVLACVLSDAVWNNISKDPTGTVVRKIQWWYWGSLFGGAYQKAHSSIDKRILADIPRLMAYISKPVIKWSDISDLSDDESTDRGFTELKILGSKGKLGNRFEMICDVDGYSNKEALIAAHNKTMGMAILSFSIKNGLSDFKYRDKTNGSHELERGECLHVGRTDLQADHLYAVNSWYKFTGEQVDRNGDHPINSPLNYSWISAKANRYWSDNPSFQKLELESAIKGNKDSIDFLHHHLLSIESVECEYENISLGSEDYQKQNATKILKALLEKRFEKLRQSILAENPES
ncbi:DUF262 domain-containing protein [Chamaesiphon sp. OTE_8_metabat_110]|uniref:DUF262 domain-containing protein n=1 Tax=Chamaesiphon sp. OTE_8_metabat_110 TaxID=2964696 RepID=UPI00286C4C49|nr:DUF262 domain-containing protein [Chamaesiphon sp. OTE_8_metabat_110]